MKLAKATEQAIGVMAIIATQMPDVPVSSKTINQRVDISPTYLHKLLRKLVVAGLITSVSGNNGGFSLAKPRNKMKVIEVVEAIEGPIVTYQSQNILNHIFSDFQQEATAGDQNLAGVFKKADIAWSNVLEKTSIQDVLDSTLGEKNTKIIHDWNNY